MSKVINLFIILIFHVTVVRLSAQPSTTYTTTVEHFGLKDGLSSKFVSGIVRDNRGLVWVSTLRGLNRFDGRKFKSFTTEDGLNSNYITHLYAVEDALWCVHYNEEIGGFEDFSIFHPIKERGVSFEAYFDNKAPFSKEDILGLEIGNVLFFGLKNGSAYVYTDKKGWKKLKIEQGELFITAIDEDYLVYKKSDSGGYLRRLNDKGETIFKKDLPFKVSYEDTFILCEKPVISNQGDLWLTYSYMHGDGFLIVTPKGDLTAFQGHYPLFEQYFKDFFQKEIFAVYLPKRNAFAYADEDVFFLFDTEGKPLYTNDKLDMEGKTIFCADVEREIFWVLGRDGGFYQLELKENKFQNLTFDNSIGFRGINRIGNQLYFNCSTGVFEYDKNKGKGENILPIGLATATDKNNHLWVSTYGGFWEYDPIAKTKELHAIDYLREIWALYVDSKNKIWYSKNGLHCFDPKTNKHTEVEYGGFEDLRTSMIYFFYEKKDGHILLCTTSGLYEWHPQKGIIARYWKGGKGKYYLPSSDFRHLYFDKKDQTYWLASRQDGLIHWQPQTEKYTAYQLHRLGSNTLHAVYPNTGGKSDDYLWLSTENGVVQFHKKTGNFVVYSSKDGLLSDEMNRIAHFQDEDGTIYLGSGLGVTAFRPKDFDLESQENVSEIIIAELNQYLSATQKIENLTARFHQENQITLYPGDRFFTLTLALVDYKENKNAIYKYKIKGRDKDWLTENTNTITMSGLPYGHQTLMIQASMENGLYSKILEIPIFVKRPFYLTSWFIFSVLLIISLGILFIIRWRTQRLKKQTEWLTEEVEKRTETIMAQAEALKEMDSIKTKFFSNITHEFRTPLTLILGPAKQLYDKEDELQKQKQLAGILKNSRHLLDLINQLLDLSKLESGKMAMSWEYGDITEYTESFLDDFRALAKSKQQKLVFLANSTDWETYFDKDKWHKIISNLLSNAIKYTEVNGEIILKFNRIIQEEKEYIYLKVKDNGTGIHQNDLPRIFNRFYQVDGSTTRFQEGAGIGLALVKELVELQGGTITVQSTIGEGTTFEIYIPIPQNVQVTTSSTAENHSVNNTFLEAVELLTTSPATARQETPSAKAFKVLIIEDNAEMRDYLKSCIDSTKYDITTAKDGQEGIEKALKIVPDLVISDVMMPRKDGFEVVTAIREHLATSHIPIVLLTAKAALESRLEGLRRGADAYLTKPFSPEELVATMAQLIKIRQLIQQRYQNNSDNAVRTPEVKVYEQEDTFINELKAYIIKNISDAQLSVIGISEHFFMSRTQLYRKVKALTDDTVTNFITKIRLEYALELMQKEQLSLSEVAYKVGFSSPSYFSTAFKRAYGKTPSEV